MGLSTNSGNLLYMSRKCNPLLVTLKVTFLSSCFIKSFSKRNGRYSLVCLYDRNAFNINFELDKVLSFTMHRSMSAIISILLRCFILLLKKLVGFSCYVSSSSSVSAPLTLTFSLVTLSVTVRVSVTGFFLTDTSSFT